MNDVAAHYLLLGATFLVGLVADAIGRKTILPRVTLVLVVGFLVGPQALDLLPKGFDTLYERGAEIALTMVGFLLGERLLHSLRDGDARVVLAVSLAAVLVTAGVVFLGLWLLGMDGPTALLLAGIATATAPAATMDVIREMKCNSPLAKTLLGVVAIDDAWGLLTFSILMAGAKVWITGGEEVWEPLVHGMGELGIALVFGLVLGGIMAAITGRISKGEPTLLEALGFVFVACGAALATGVSFILVAMVMGVVVARFAKHHEHPFHVIEDIEIPFMILFFALAGASLDPGALLKIGWIGAAYMGLRILGRLAGGWIGAWASSAPSRIRSRIGLGLLPQAGVALGMALLAKQSFPERGDLVLQITIGSTVFFELFGPMASRFALREPEPS